MTRKFLLALLVPLCFIFSCKKDDQQEPDEIDDPIVVNPLIKKVTVTDLITTEVERYNLFYNDSDHLRKIDGSIGRVGFEYNYFYESEKLNRWTLKFQNTGITYEYNLTYSGDQLDKEYIGDLDDEAMVLQYYYNGDTVTTEFYEFDDPGEPKIIGYTKYIKENGNIGKIEEFDRDMVKSGEAVFTFETEANFVKELGLPWSFILPFIDYADIPFNMNVISGYNYQAPDTSLTIAHQNQYDETGRLINRTTSGNGINLETMEVEYY